MASADEEKGHHPLGEAEPEPEVKTLYGRKEEARIGYKPMKPGRPWHVYQAILFTAAERVINVAVQAGNQMASQYAQSTFWGWLEERERKYWPTLLRREIAHGSEEMMAGAEPARGGDHNAAAVSPGRSAAAPAYQSDRALALQPAWKGAASG